MGTVFTTENEFLSVINLQRLSSILTLAQVGIFGVWAVWYKTLRMSNFEAQLTSLKDIRNRR